MKNTIGDSGESGQMTANMNQQHEIGFNLPPPYSIENTMLPNFGANSAFGPNASNPTLNLFNQTLGNNETFLLAPVGRFGFTTRTIIVQLQDSVQRPLMSIMTIPGQNISAGRHNDNSVRVGSIIQMANTSGQTLLTARENGQSITISSGEHVLGIVEGNLLCNTSLHARGVMGDVLFESIGGTEMNPSTSGCCGTTPSEFTLISNGVPLARIQKPTNGTSGGTLSLINSRNFDDRTKALLVFTGYLMYYAFLAETSFGKIGARGFAKRVCMFLCIFFLVIVVLMISIPIAVISTKF